MNALHPNGPTRKFDRAYLLSEEKRNDCPRAVRNPAYGRDSFGDPDYVSDLRACSPRSGTRAAYGSPRAPRWNAPATGSPI